ASGSNPNVTRSGGRNPTRRFRFLSLAFHRPPELIRLEVLIIEVDVELKAVEAGVIDLLAGRVERRRHHREPRRRVEEHQALAALGQVWLAAGRELTLDALQRRRVLRPRHRAEVLERDAGGLLARQGVEQLAVAGDGGADAGLGDRVLA